MSSRTVRQQGILELFTSHSPISFIYRVIELADGWRGRIVSTELYFGQSLFLPVE